MDRILPLFMLSTLLLIHFENPQIDAAPFQPIVEIVTGHSRVFTGETVRLKCIPPATPYKSTWTYTWYHGSKQLPHTGEQLILWNIKTKDTGKYYCQGIRDTSVRDIPTFHSVPVEISVAGGWAILNAPSKGVVGYPMNMTCRVRGNYPVHEVILYRNGQTILKQDDPNFLLNNFTLAAGGQYSCRASWNRNSHTYSVISDQVSVQVAEPLTQPTLIIVDDANLHSLSKLKLVCLVEYNIPAPAPPVLYYFYINGQRHGTPTSDNYHLIERSKGPFKCKAMVNQLSLSQWSEPKVY